MENNEIDVEYHFASCVYKTKREDFLNLVSPLFEEHLKGIEDTVAYTDISSVEMTSNLAADLRFKPLLGYICETAWQLLDSQGFSMMYYETIILDAFGQVHKLDSNQDQHMHGMSSHISGFYFIDVPEETRFIIHDPRPGKISSGLIEKNFNAPSIGSNLVVMKPEAGTIVFTNSWLPHSFPRNPSNKPLKFIHFNVGARLKFSNPSSNLDDRSIAEII